MYEWQKICENCSVGKNCPAKKKISEFARVCANELLVKRFIDYDRVSDLYQELISKSLKEVAKSCNNYRSKPLERIFP